MPQDIFPRPSTGASGEESRLRIELPAAAVAGSAVTAAGAPAFARRRHVPKSNPCLKFSPSSRGSFPRYSQAVRGDGPEEPISRTTCEYRRNKSRESCTRMHFYGCFCTCGRVAIRCYEQNRPLRLIFVHDSPGGHRRRATAGRGGYDRAGSGGLGPSGPPPRHARCQTRLG